MVIDPASDPNTSSTSRVPPIVKMPQRMTSAFLFVVVTSLAVVPVSCGSSTNCQDPKNAGNIGCVIEGAIVDCTGVSSLPSAIAVVTPIVEKLVVSALQPDGSIKWAAIESQLVDIALQYGMCVLAEVWNHLMSGGGGGSGGGPGSGAGSAGSAGSAGPRVARKALPAASLAAEFDRLRGRVAPKRQFKTSKGTL
jgi:uncharacterized membrane protein YgcG